MSMLPQTYPTPPSRFLPSLFSLVRAPPWSTIRTADNPPSSPTSPEASPFYNNRVLPSSMPGRRQWPPEDAAFSPSMVNQPPIVDESPKSSTHHLQPLSLFFVVSMLRCHREATEAHCPTTDRRWRSLSLCRCRRGPHPLLTTEASIQRRNLQQVRVTIFEN